MKRITILIFVIALTSTFSQGQLIINHLNTDITTLTQDEINNAKSVLHIAYGHTSHGSQVTDGMTGLVGFANGGGKELDLPTDFFAWNDGGTDDALDLEDYAMGGDVGYFPAWRDNTLSFLGTVDPTTGRGTNNPDVNVIMWSWCGQAAGYSQSQMISDYLNPMKTLEGIYFGVKFVYMTCHLDGSGAAGNLNVRDQQIRDYCTANKKILYDFEDIESYDPDGLVNYMELFANDNCDYDSLGFSRNWATRWQNTHEEGFDWYDVSCAHSQSLNGNQKAYAAWRMFAEIAKLIELDAIPATLTVSDTIVGDTKSACFDATDTLTITGETDTVEFQSGSSVDLIAGKSVRLLPGFRAFEGSTIHATITTDDQYCFSSSAAIADNNGRTKKSMNIEPSVIKKENQVNDKQVKIFPNPNNGRFKVELTNCESQAEITIFNASGIKVYETRSSTSEEINLVDIDKGLYFVQIRNGVSVETRKIVIGL
jgi:hypothetical protein